MLKIICPYNVNKRIRNKIYIRNKEILQISNYNNLNLNWLKFKQIYKHWLFEYNKPKMNNQILNKDRTRNRDKLMIETQNVELKLMLMFKIDKIGILYFILI